MIARKLVHQVHIPGNSLFGFKTHITLTPTSKPGWFVRTSDGELTPITVSMMRRGLSRNVNARVRRTFVLKIVEHLMAVRLGLGLYDGIIIEWPRRGIPYDGGAALFAEALRPVSALDREPGMHTVARKLGPFPTANGKGHISFAPTELDALIIRAQVDYGNHGSAYIEWDDSKDSFEDIESSRGELKPHLRMLVRTVSLFGFPHGNAFADRKRMPTSEWLTSVAKHHVIDVLGTLPFAIGNGKLAGIYDGKRAGHGDCIRLAQLIAKNLIRVR